MTGHLAVKRWNMTFYLPNVMTAPLRACRRRVLGFLLSKANTLAEGMRETRARFRAPGTGETWW